MAENPKQPKAKQITLPIVVMKARDHSAHLKPILFIDGGPGQKTFTHPEFSNKTESMQESMNDWFDSTRVFRLKRDFILFEQRGVGLSQPALDCPELDKLAAHYAGKIIQPDRVLALQKQVLITCHQRLLKQNIALGQYNTKNTVSDI